MRTLAHDLHFPLHRLYNRLHRTHHRGSARKAGVMGDRHGIDAKSFRRGKFQPPIIGEYPPEIALVGRVCKRHLPSPMPPLIIREQGFVIREIPLDTALSDMGAKGFQCPHTDRIK